MSYRASHNFFSCSAELAVNTATNHYQKAVNVSEPFLALVSPQVTCTVHSMLAQLYLAWGLAGTRRACRKTIIDSHDFAVADEPVRTPSYSECSPICKRHQLHIILFLLSLLYTCVNILFEPRLLLHSLLHTSRLTFLHLSVTLLHLLSRRLGLSLVVSVLDFT